MEFKGTPDFTLFVDNTMIWYNNKPKNGYRALICNRKTKNEVLTLTGTSYELVVIHSNRICNDLQLEYEKRQKADSSKQLGLQV